MISEYCVPRNIVDTFSHRLSSQPFAGTPTTRTAPSSGRARPTSCQPGRDILLNFRSNTNQLFPINCRQSLSLIMTTMIIGFSQFVINILLPSTDAFTRIRAVNERQVSHCPEKALKDSSRVLFWALCNFSNVR